MQVAPSRLSSINRKNISTAPFGTGAFGLLRIATRGTLPTTVTARRTRAAVKPMSLLSGLMKGFGSSGKGQASLVEFSAAYGDSGSCRA